MIVFEFLSGEVVASDKGHGTRNQKEHTIFFTTFCLLIFICCFIVKAIYVCNGIS